MKEHRRKIRQQSPLAYQAFRRYKNKGWTSLDIFRVEDGTIFVEMNDHGNKYFDEWNPWENKFAGTQRCRDMGMQASTSLSDPFQQFKS